MNKMAIILLRFHIKMMYFHFYLNIELVGKTQKTTVRFMNSQAGRTQIRRYTPVSNFRLSNFLVAFIRP